MYIKSNRSFLLTISLINLENEIFFKIIYITVIFKLYR